MVSFGRIFGSSTDRKQEVLDKGFEVSDCSFDCDECTNKFPKSLKVDSGPLWNSTSEYGLHLVVSTGRIDWSHNALSASGRVAREVSAWADESERSIKGLEHSNSIKVSASSLSSDKSQTDSAYENGDKTDILILPFFVWIRDVSWKNVRSLLDYVIPEVINANHSGKGLDLKLDSFEGASVEMDAFQSYIFLCSHKSRDKRCGITAPIMKKEIDIHLRDMDLLRDFGDHRPNGINVVFINHVGGHKYSANVLLYTKKGYNIWLARCTPANAKPIIEECILGNGKVWPEQVRLIQKFKAVEW